MSPHETRWRRRLLPTPLLAPVIAIFTGLPIPSPTTNTRRRVFVVVFETTSSRRPSADETSPILGAVSRREGEWGCTALLRIPAASLLWPQRRDLVRPGRSPC